MSPAPSLLPTGRTVRAATAHGAVAALDVVHDHVLRIVADADTAERLVLDVVLRANARTAELGEPSTLPVLLRLARARLAPLAVDHLDAANLTSLAPEGDPAARAVAAALAVPSERAASLLDLTVRHGLDTRTAADVLDLDVRQVATVRAEALRQVRAALAEMGGDRIDVEATLAAQPVAAAPPALHDRFAARDGRRVPSALAWLAPPAAVAVLTASLLVGLPDALAGAVDAEVPLVGAVAVDDGAVVQQLVADGDQRPAGPEGELAVRRSVSTAADAPSTTDEAQAPTATEAPSPAPSDEPAPDEPADEPTAAPSPTPEPEPSPDPLGDLLPTGP